MAQGLLRATPEVCLPDVPHSSAPSTPAFISFSYHSRPCRGRRVFWSINSWSNLKIVYNAGGDGIADDTAAFQTALDEIGQSSQKHVLYIPAGTYRITSRLRLDARIYVSIIGEDPAITTIKWDGPQDRVMIWINGVPDRRTRLTVFATGLETIAANSSSANDISTTAGVIPNLSESVSCEIRTNDGKIFQPIVEFAGSAADLPGLNQVNVILPAALKGAGTCKSF